MKCTGSQMTLTQAIEHAGNIGSQLPQTGCVQDHAQLAKWLCELQRDRAALQSIASGKPDGETYEMFHDRARHEARAALGR